MLLDVRYRLLSDEHSAGCWREVLRSDIKKTGNRETNGSIWFLPHKEYSKCGKISL